MLTQFVKNRVTVCRAVESTKGQRTTAASYETEDTGVTSGRVSMLRV